MAKVDKPGVRETISYCYLVIDYELTEAVAAGRANHCNELVFMRKILQTLKDKSDKLEQLCELT